MPSSFNRWLACLAVLLLAARAILPAGWMLDQDASGAVRITLCGGGDHSRSLWLDPATRTLSDETPAPSQDTPDDTCPFAMIAAATLPPASVDPVEPVLFMTLLGARPMARDHLSSLRTVILPPSRGPPVHA